MKIEALKAFMLALTLVAIIAFFPPAEADRKLYKITIYSCNGLKVEKLVSSYYEVINFQVSVAVNGQCLRYGEWKRIK